MPHSEIQVKLRLTTELIRRLRIRGGAPHIPIEVIWSEVQTRVGTPHKILRCFRSIGGGAPHIPIEVRVGTPHKVLEQLG